MWTFLSLHFDDEGDEKGILPYVDELLFDREELLPEDCILEHNVHKTRRGDKPSHHIERQGKVVSK